MTILIVDDSKAMRMIVMRHLRQAGFGHHTLDEAGNGVEALASVTASRPDLILCDWNMPEMNGLEFLTSLRARSLDVPFGFVTTESSPEMRANATNAGAAFLIAKPFTVEMFQTALAPYLN
jgi:two-component system chemotaxis response regulator CheY